MVDLTSCRKRIDTLEHKGQAIAERAKHLYSDLEELSLLYSNAVSIDFFNHQSHVFILQ